MPQRLLLTIDVGNTQTVLRLFKKRELVGGWRISTRRDTTSDEFAVSISDLFKLAGFTFKDIMGVVVSSVVPSVTGALREMSTGILNMEPLFVDSETKTGIPILYDDPFEMGADRIANAVAGVEIYGSPLIVVDFGTATTFDAISKSGEYLGGAIAPGVEVSAEALFGRAARLSKVDLVHPTCAIGTNTRKSIQAGVMIGTGGLVDRVVERFEDEMGKVEHVVATGGLAALMAPECKRITAIDTLLTLTGLQRIYERNKEIPS